MQQAGWQIRCERYRKILKSKTKAVTASLQISFFTSPTTEKRPLPLLLRKLLQIADFLLGKVHRRIVIHYRANPLDIHAHSAIGRDSNQRDPPRVGNVEPWTPLSLDSRFSGRLVDKSDGGGIDAQGARQDQPQVRTRQDETDGIALEAKTVRAPAFGLIQKGIKREGCAESAIHVQAPDVNCARHRRDAKRLPGSNEIVTRVQDIPNCSMIF